MTMTTKTATMAMAIVLTVVMTACGGSSSSPTSPAAPPIPSYAGTWTGNYTITGCTQNGGMALANICGSMGTAAPYRFNFAPTAHYDYVVREVQLTGAAQRSQRGSL